MKQDLIFMIDRSLSTYGFKEHILSFYRDILKHYQADEALVTICLFADEANVLCFRQPLNVASGLLMKEYYNDGSSAIFDSICSFVKEWDNYIGITHAIESNVRLFVITDKTDNASIANTYHNAAEILNTKRSFGWKSEFYDMQLNEFRIEELDLKGARNGSQQ